MRLVTACSATVLVGGCTNDDFPEIRYETEHLRIGTAFDQPICEGTLQQLDGHVATVESLLDLSVEEPIELYIYEELPADACGGGGNVYGCTEPDPRRVITEWGPIQHELVHAVAFELAGRRADPLFDEGLALAFWGYRSEIGWQAPTDALGREDLDYFSAGHFMRWLFEEHGAAPLRTLLSRSKNERGNRYNERQFEKAYGFDLAQAEAEFFETAPELYPGFGVCNYPTLPIDPADLILDTSITFDCSAADTRGSEYLAQVFQWEIETAGDYVIEIEDPAQARLSYCYPDVLPRGQSKPVDPNPPVGEISGGRSGWAHPEWIDATSAVHLELGSVRVEVRVPAESDGSVARLRIHPAVSGSSG